MSPTLSVPLVPGVNVNVYSTVFEKFGYSSYQGDWLPKYSAVSPSEEGLVGAMTKYTWYGIAAFLMGTQATLPLGCSCLDTGPIVEA